MLGKHRQFGTCLAGLILACAAGAPAQEEAAPGEKLNKVKAAFFFNFLNYTQWPDESMASEEAPLVVAFLEAPRVGAIFKDSTAERKVGRHALAIRFLDAPEGDAPLTESQAQKLKATLADCHAVYVGRSQAPRLASVLGVARHPGLMVVSDAGASAESGAAIELALDREKQRMFFRVNLEAVKTAKLKISSKLLRLAEIVRKSSSMREPASPARRIAQRD